jgi:hypothetical protein
VLLWKQTTPKKPYWYSGVTDGHVLTWDSTNGWQAEAPTGGGYTDEQAQDAVGTILTDSASIDFTYNDATPSITAVIKPDSVTDAMLRESAALSVIGRDTNSTGNPADIVAPANGYVLQRGSNTLYFDFLDATVSIQQSTGYLLGRTTASTGLTEHILPNSLHLTFAAGVLGLATTGVSANTYGSASLIPVITVDVYGRVTNVTTAAIVGLTDGDKGDITVSSSGTAWTIDANAVTNTKLADMATATFKGRTTAGTGDPEDLTATQATALLNVFTSLLKGLVPASGGGTTNFLRADGTWAAPATGVTGSGAANHLAIWTGAGTIAHDTDFPVDLTNGRLGVGPIGGSPSAVIHAGAASGGTIPVFLFNVNGSSEVNAKLLNAGLGRCLWQIATGSASAGDPFLQFTITGVTDWSAGVDNSDSDKFKIKNQTDPSASSNTGLTITAGATSHVGVNRDAPTWEMDVNGRMRATSIAVDSGISAANFSFGTGAGTGPVLNSVTGGQSAFTISFTTGTTPTAGQTIWTYTLPTAATNGVVLTYVPVNDNAVTYWANYRVSLAGTTAARIIAPTGVSMPASTQIILNCVIVTY